MKKIYTLTFVMEGTSILLGLKKRGFGVGRWNGFGGKVQPQESIEDAAKRELQEESGLFASQLKKVGILEFRFINDPTEILEAHVFVCTSYSGEVGESEEMQPKWFKVDQIPFNDMWKDDIFWFPLFLQKKKFKGRFLFSGNDEVLENELREVDVLE